MHVCTQINCLTKAVEVSDSIDTTVSGPVSTGEIMCLPNAYASAALGAYKKGNPDAPTATGTYLSVEAPKPFIIKSAN